MSASSRELKMFSIMWKFIMGTTNEIMSYFSDFFDWADFKQNHAHFPQALFSFHCLYCFCVYFITVHIDASVVCQKQLLTGQYSFWGWEVLIRLPFFRWWLIGSLPYTSWQSNQVASLHREGGPGVDTVEFLGIH